MYRISSRDPDDPTPALIFTIGIPGSGKSTWIKSMLESNEHGEIVIVSPDEIRYELTGNMSDQSVNYKAWMLAKQRTTDALKAGKDVILDATNVVAKNRKNFLKGLPPHALYAKTFETKPEEAISRVKKDIEEGKNRSNVPEDVIRKMHENFENQSTSEKLEEEGFEKL
jgi:predicted kinase